MMQKSGRHSECFESQHAVSAAFGAGVWRKHLVLAGQFVLLKLL